MIKSRNIGNNLIEGYKAIQLISSHRRNYKAIQLRKNKCSEMRNMCLHKPGSPFWKSTACADGTDDAGNESLESHQMYEYGPSVRALQSNSQELSSLLLPPPPVPLPWPVAPRPRTGLYSSPGSNCIRTNTCNRHIYRFFK